MQEPQGALRRWSDERERKDARERKLGGHTCQFPGGDEFDKGKCNIGESRIEDATPVGQYSPQGDSPYGCGDMAGNVWEWTSSLYKDYPYQADDGREDESSTNNRVRRGGAYDSSASSVTRCVFRLVDDPINVWSSNVGFRCGVGAAPEERITETLKQDE